MGKKYRVVAGIHFERNLNAGQEPGKHDPHRHIRHQMGDVIESERDLVAAYPNKFEEVFDPQANVVVTPERKDAVGGLIVTGVWAEEDRDFLEHLSDENFQRTKALADRVKAQRDNPPEKAKEEEEADKDEKPKHPLGEDVTDGYPKASFVGLRVYRNQVGKYQVVNMRATGRQANRPVNPQPLDGGEVDAFIENYGKGK